MTQPIRLANLLSLSFILSLTLNACSDQQELAGGEDFPNTIADVDSLITQVSQFHKENPIPGANISPETEFNLNNNFGDPLIQNSPWSVIDSGYLFQDTSTGLLYYYTQSTYQQFTKYDTLTLQYNESVKDFQSDTNHAQKLFQQLIQMNTHLQDTNGNSYRQTISDLDGNTLINDNPNQVKITQETHLAPYVKMSEIHLAPGPDLDFDTPSDNIIFEGKEWILFEGALTDSTHYQASAGNSSVYDGSRIPGTFELHQFKARGQCQTHTQLTALYLDTLVDESFPIHSTQTTQCPQFTQIQTLDSIPHSESTGLTKLTQIHSGTHNKTTELTLAYELTDTLELKLTQFEETQDSHPGSDSTYFKITPNSPIELGEELLNAEFEGIFYTPEETYTLKGSIIDGQTQGTFEDQEGNQHEIQP